MLSSVMTANQQLCALPGCNNHAFHRDGITHDYCGRTHAKIHQGTRFVAAPHGSCMTCRYPGCDEQVFYDKKTDRVHEFCSRTHATLFNAVSGTVNAATGHKKCQLTGCNKKVFFDVTNNREHDYCGKTHALEDQQQRSLPMLPPAPAKTTAPAPADATCALHGCNLLVAGPGKRYCTRRHYQTGKSRKHAPVQNPHEAVSFEGPGGWTVSLLKQSHPKYNGVRTQFFQQWQKPSTPKLKSIWKVTTPDNVYYRYVDYLQRFGNEQRRFHGTSTNANCFVGINQGRAPCPDTSGCPLCNICKHGFDIAYAGARTTGTTGIQRYGDGLYFSAVSGKSNDYSVGSQKYFAQANHRVMFLCRVALGRQYQTKEGDLTQSKVDRIVQQGYQTVSGEVGNVLNYPEDVVYDNAAALPSYLIVYSV